MGGAEEAAPAPSAHTKQGRKRASEALNFDLCPHAVGGFGGVLEVPVLVSDSIAGPQLRRGGV